MLRDYERSEAIDFVISTIEPLFETPSKYKEEEVVNLPVVEIQD